MSREIKYRVWDKEAKKMSSWHYVQDWDIGSVMRKEKYEFMQYTGFKINGTEVYEGDVVKVPTEQYRMFLAAGKSGDEEMEKTKPYFVIGWEEEPSGFMAKRINDVIELGVMAAKGIYMSIALGYDKDENEVIGNIYENENLLKDE